MKTVSPEKQNVAWFKLAECVGRGEKERALSLFRLLTYSIEDRAFTKKLEADILVFFEESGALIQYLQAAHLYYQSGRTLEACMVYEKMLELETRPEFLEKVAVLYIELNDKKKATFYQKKLYQIWLERGKVAKAVEQFSVCEDMLDDAQKIDSYKQIINAALIHKYAQQKTISHYLHKALDGLLRFGSDKELQLFLSELKAINNMWHKDAVSYLEQSIC